jgi:hypothetical protein
LALLTLLTLLTLLALFAILTALLLAALHLVHAEGLVHHLLLAAHDLAELVHLLAHLALLAVLALLLLAAGLQVVHHVLQLCQEIFRLIAVARFGQVFDLVHHPFEIALAQFLSGLHLGHRQVRVARGALSEFAQEFVHRLAQFLHQFVDFLVAGAVLQRLLQGFLRLAQALLGLREVAVLDLQRHLPQIVRHVA